MPHSQGIDAPGFDRAHLDAMRREANAGTGVFGLRLMWASMAEATRRLDCALGTERDLVESVEAAFGPTLYVHVSRQNKIAQAISLLRAERSGLWHLAADGSVLEGVDAPRSVRYDRARISELREKLEADDASWAAFFEARGITPVRLAYEAVAADPGAALRRILAALGLDLAALGLDPEGARSVPVPIAKMGDD